MVRALEGQREKRGAEIGVQKERAVMVVHGGASRKHAHNSTVHVASPWTAVAFDPGSE